MMDTQTALDLLKTHVTRFRDQMTQDELANLRTALATLQTVTPMIAAIQQRIHEITGFEGYGELVTALEDIEDLANAVAPR